MAKTYSCEIQVRVFELDSFGHVNHAQYVSYLEHARWKMMSEEGITINSFDEWQSWPVVTELQLRYRRPALADETLEIRTTCVRKTPVRLTYDQGIYRGEELILEASVTAAMVDTQGRPVRMHPKMAQTAAGVVNK